MCIIIIINATWKSEIDQWTDCLRLMIDVWVRQTGPVHYWNFYADELRDTRFWIDEIQCCAMCAVMAHSSIKLRMHNEN